MTGKFAQRWLRGSFLHSSIAKCWIKDVLWQENLHLATKSQVLQPAGLLPPQIWRAWLDFVEGKFWERWIWIGRCVRFCLQTNPTVLAKMLAMWKVGGIKIAWNFFLQTHKEISEKRNIFVNPSVTENFQREHFSGRVCRNRHGLSFPNISLRKGGTKLVDRVLLAQSRLRVTKRDLLVKTWEPFKNYSADFFR